MLLLQCCGCSAAVVDGNDIVSVDNVANFAVVAAAIELQVEVTVVQVIVVLEVAGADTTACCRCSC